ncbi:TRDC protein, partial [Brachypteracias leptosomus]|nr:TRDC protein [Brachypteracias leptosomus]
LKSKEPKQYDNKLNVACLARAFYPKNISLDVPKSDVVYDLKAPLVTPEGTYSTMKVAGVEPGADMTCKAVHKGNKTTTRIILPGTVLWSTHNAILGATSSKNFFSYLLRIWQEQKANMLSVAVLGLRVLLAKSIAFNTIVSIRLFLF